MEHAYITDTYDLIRVLHYYGPPLRECAGGRTICPGYGCPHCNSVNPKSKCYSPRREPEPVPRTSGTAPRWALISKELRERAEMWGLDTP